MILQNDLEAAKELKEKLCLQMRLREFKIFGSRARGDARDDSDLDIFIVIDKPASEWKERIRSIAWDVGLSHGLVISTLIFSFFDITETPLRSSPIVKNIEKEGVTV